MACSVILAVVVWSFGQPLVRTTLVLGGDIVRDDGQYGHTNKVSLFMTRQSDRDAATDYAVVRGESGKLQSSTPVPLLRDFHVSMHCNFPCGNPPLSLSPDGGIIYVANNTYGIIGYDTSDMREHPGPIFHVSAHEIAALALSPDGKTIYAGGSGGRIFGFSTSMRTEVFSNYTGDDVTSLVVSPDGATIYSGDFSGNIYGWNTRTGTKKKAKLSGKVRCLAVSPDGGIIYSGDDRGISLWNQSTLDFISVIEQSSRVNSLAVSPDGAWIFSSDLFGSILRCSWSTKQCTSSPNVAPALKSLVLSPDGATIYSGDSNGIISSRNSLALLVVNKMDATSRVPKHGDDQAPLEISSLVVSPDGTTIYHSDTYGNILGWNQNQTAPKQLFSKELDALIHSVVVSPDGLRIYSCFWNEGTGITVNIFGWTVVMQEKVFSTQIVTQMPELCPLAVSPDGHTIYSGASNSIDGGNRYAGSISGWSTSTREPRETVFFRSVSHAIENLVLSPNGATIYSAGRKTKDGDGYIFGWNTNTSCSEPDPIFSKHVSNLTSLVLSPNGSTIYSGDEGGNVFGWSSSTKKQVFKASASNSSCMAEIGGSMVAIGGSGVQSLVVTPDGAKIFAGACDGNISGWNTQTQQRVFWMHALSSVNDLKLSPDGKTIYCSEFSGNISSWSSDTSQDQVAGVTLMYIPCTSSILAVSPHGALFSGCVYPQFEEAGYPGISGFWIGGELHAVKSVLEASGSSSSAASVCEVKGITCVAGPGGSHYNMSVDGHNHMLSPTIALASGLRSFEGINFSGSLPIRWPYGLTQLSVTGSNIVDAGLPPVSLVTSKLAAGKVKTLDDSWLFASGLVDMRETPITNRSFVENTGFVLRSRKALHTSNGRYIAHYGFVGVLVADMSQSKRVYFETGAKALCYGNLTSFWMPTTYYAGQQWFQLGRVLLPQGFCECEAGSFGDGSKCQLCPENHYCPAPGDAGTANVKPTRCHWPLKSPKGASSLGACYLLRYQPALFYVVCVFIYWVVLGLVAVACWEKRKILRANLQAQELERKRALDREMHERELEANLKAQEQKVRDLLVFQAQIGNLAAHGGTETVRVLGSCPHRDLANFDCLRQATKLIERVGGFNLAGDARDYFHTHVLPAEVQTNEIKGWRIAWLGKLEAGIGMAMKAFPRARVVLYTIDGGPETQWELSQIQGPRLDGLQPLKFRLWPRYENAVERSQIEVERCCSLAEFRERLRVAA